VERLNSGKMSKGVGQNRRLLALVEVYDGGKCRDAPIVALREVVRWRLKDIGPLGI